MNARLNAPRWEHVQSLPGGFPTGSRRWARRGSALVQACALRIARAAEALASRLRPGEPAPALPAAVGASDADLARLRLRRPTEAL